MQADIFVSNTAFKLKKDEHLSPDAIIRLKKHGETRYNAPLAARVACENLK